MLSDRMPGKKKVKKNELEKKRKETTKNITRHIRRKKNTEY